jgi:Poxvirus A22 protein
MNQEIVISFDPGIKNMGVCVMKSKDHMIDWCVWSFDQSIKDLVHVLDSYMSFIFDKLSIKTNTEFTLQVIIEKQPPYNRKTIRIQTILETYFTCHCFGIHSLIKLMNVTNRWKCMNLKMPLTYTERKQLAVNSCLEKITEPDWLYYFVSHKKRDDLADAYLQALTCY